MIEISGVFLLSLLLAGCSDWSEREDVGFDDGYAVGYNTACGIRTSVVEGDFNNDRYANAYERGREAGAAACLTDREGGGPQ